MRMFLRELRRRRVFRTAGFYVVGAWLVMQAADVFFPGWGLPEAAINILLIAAVLGFPLALIFGWFFDVTAHGIVRTPSAGEEGGDAPLSLQRTDYLVLAALVIVAGIIVYDTTTEIIETPRVDIEDPASGDELIAREALPNSLAVLPFANVSDDQANEYFCDGISEEILHKLADFRELHVIGRTSSFTFKDSDYTISKIADLLGVRYLLQGSVRKYEDQLRITAQLVDDRGVQIWSDAFDRRFEDIFSIQAEIADVVATTVVPQISPGHTEKAEPDLAAYELYLAGRAMFHRRSPGAADVLAEAIALDPEFAEAHAELAMDMLIGAPTADDIQRAQQAIDTALSLRPGLPRALAARGLLLLQQRKPDPRAAEVVLREALASDPNMVDAMLWLSNALGQLGEDTESIALLKRAQEIDPLHPSVASNLASDSKDRGDWEGAERLLMRLAALPEPPRFAFMGLRELYIDRGRLVDMRAVEQRSALLGQHVYFGLAWAYAAVGLWDSAAYWIERTERDFPQFVWTWMYPGIVPNWQGRYIDALEALRRSKAERQISLESMDARMSMIFGTTEALAGECDAAIKTLEPVLAESERVLIYDIELDGRHALAWCYIRLGLKERADTVLKKIEEAFREVEALGRLNNSRDLFYFAQNALLMGHHDAALDRLERAVRGGWRLYYIQRHDPRWAVLADNPRYRARMAEVTADLDRQRVEIERLDAEEDFPALLDRVQASRQ